MPWRVFKRNSYMEGTSPAQAAQDFCNLVNDPEVHCKFRRGQWLVPDFQGVKALAGTVERDGYIVNRECEVKNSEDMCNFLQHGQGQFDQRLRSVEASSSSGARSLPVDTPNIGSAGLLQQRVQSLPTDFSLSMIQQEVVLMLL